MPLNRSNILKLFTKEWKGMQACFIAFCYTNEAERIHQMRMHIKKLNTLLFFSENKNRDLKKDFAPVKFLFKESGEIRSRYIHLELLKETKLLTKNIERQLTDEIMHQSRLLLLHQPKYTRQLSHLGKKIGSKIQSINKEKLTECFKYKIKELSLLYQKQFNDANKIHESRKVLKSLIYFDCYLNKKTRRKLKLNKDYLTHLQTEIGNWHDLHDTIIYLKYHDADKKILKKLSQLNRSAISLVKKETKKFNEKVFLRQ